MKKRVLAIILSGALALNPFSVFAEDNVELRMSWWGGNGRHQATLNAIKEFEKKYPNIKVKTEYTGWDGHLSRLTTQIAGKTEPDVMQTNWNWLPVFSKSGDGFYDLNTVSDYLDLTQFDANDLASTTVEGKLNGIPTSANARLFYYNDETWKKSGIDYPNNWDELIAAGNHFKTTLGEQYYPVVLEHQDTLALIRSFMTQKYNQPIIDETEKKFAYSDEQWVEFFNMYKTMVDNHVMPSSKYYASFGKNNMYEMKPWVNGEWGGTYMWISTVTKYSDNLTDPAKLELGPYPMLEGAKDAGLFFKPSLMFSIGKSSQHPKEAAQLINFLMNEPEGIAALGLERGIPLSKVAHEQLKAANVINDQDPSVTGLNLALSLPHDMPTSPYFDDPQIVALFLDAIQSIDYGNKTVEEAAKNFQKQGDRILKRAMR